MDNVGSEKLVCFFLSSVFCFSYADKHTRTHAQVKKNITTQV